MSAVHKERQTRKQKILIRKEQDQLYNVPHGNATPLVQKLSFKPRTGPPVRPAWCGDSAGRREAKPSRSRGTRW